MSERYKISYTARAKGDLRIIYSYLAFKLKVRRIAKRMVERIRKEVRGLDTLPERFRRVDWEPWASMGMRVLLVGNYVVYYLPDIPLRQITIFRVVYGGRDIANVISGE